VTLRILTIKSSLIVFLIYCDKYFCGKNIGSFWSSKTKLSTTTDCPQRVTRRIITTATKVAGLISGFLPQSITLPRMIYQEKTLGMQPYRPKFNDQYVTNDALCNPNTSSFIHLGIKITRPFSQG
jgi:hypothetical protein